MKIGFIGAGRMAQAFASGIVKAGFCKANQICVSDPNPESISAFQESVGDCSVAQDNLECSRDVDLLILAVKPQVFAVATQGLDLSTTSTTIVSVMGGIKMTAIESAVKTNRIIRVMPNTPCLVGAGASGMAVSETVEADSAKQVQKMLEALGLVILCPESQLDAITGLSGSGPAYVFAIIEALADGGVLMGLSRQNAQKLAAQTVYGAAKMVLDSSEHTAVLRDRVTSPGGTTIHGLQAMEDGAVRASMISAVQAATQRSLELGR